MKTYINTSFKILTALVISAGLLVPSTIVFAQTAAKSDFCNALLQPTSPIGMRIASINAKFTMLESDRTLRFERSMEEKSATRDATHRALDAKRLTQHEQLKARAKTESQKEAVNRFIESANIATAARRTAVNTAEAAYIASIKNILNQQNPVIERAAKNFKASITTIVADATENCKAGENDKVIHDTFMRELKKAHELFRTERGDAKVWRNQMSASHKTLKANVAHIEASFQADLDEAQSLLRPAFKK